MAGSFLTDLSNELDKAQRQIPDELWPQPTAPELLPVVRVLIQEIGKDPLLAEAALAWVRQKKQEAVAATLSVYYTPEQLEAMRQKAMEEANA